MRCHVNPLEAKTLSGAPSFSGPLIPMQEPIESAPAKGLTEVTFALLDSPVTGNLVREQRPKVVTFRCGQFDIKLTDPTAAHSEIADVLGPSPHVLSNPLHVRTMPYQISYKNSLLVVDNLI